MDFNLNEYMDRIHVGMASGPWIYNRRILTDLILYGDISNFLNWEMIRRTMNIEDPSDNVFEYLQALPDWDMWKEAIKELPIGRPKPYKNYLASGGNIILQAYRLAMFISKTGCDFKNLDVIIEFGGGYGCACRLAYRLGFTGKYILYDFPEFLALQEYYLIATEIYPQNKIILLSDIYDFQKQIKDIENCKSLFTAYFSISESPPILRDMVLPKIAKSIDYISIWYKDKWNEYDNIDCFSKWMEDNPNYIWECKSYHSELFYLVGKKKG